MAKPQPQQNTVEIRFGSFFFQTWEKYKRDPMVKKALGEFLRFKQATPVAAFGSKDRFFSAGALRGFLHAGLTHDISVIYRVSGKFPTVLSIYAIASHDDSGTAPGGSGNNKRQVQFVQKMNNSSFSAVKPSMESEEVPQK